MSGALTYFRAAPRLPGLRRIAFWLAVAFIFTIPWENGIQVGGVGRVSRLVGLITFVVWLAALLADRRMRAPGGLQKAYLYFLVWNGLTFFWSIDTDST